MSQEVYTDALKSAKIPVLVLDQKWHRLFAIGGKTEEVLENESLENEILEKQGKLNQENKDLKKLKSDLMNKIVENMESDSGISNEDNKRLIEEINEKLEVNEDLLLDIPNELKEVNDKLMLFTMEYCKDILQTNFDEANEITEWIANIKVELKKNIIKKQNREINNKEIYSYMHDVFGKDLINLFDFSNLDLDIITDSDREEEMALKKDLLSSKNDA